MAAKGLGGGLLLAVATQVYLNSTVLDWWSSASFGQRRMCNVTLAIVVGLAYLVYACGRLVARRRRAVKVASHVGAVFVLGVFVQWNLNKVSKLSGGKGAPQELVATCCDSVSAPVRGAARWIYDHVGDPFEFPASAVFAIEHHVPLSRWDQTVGNYPLLPSLGDLGDDDRFYRSHGVWSIGAGWLQPYLVSGWSASQRDGSRAFRFTTAQDGVVLVPNLMPDGQRMTLWLGHGRNGFVQIEWNGKIVAMALVTDAWMTVSFDLPDIALHTNELTIASTPALEPAWPAVKQPVGVAVGDLEIRLIRPH